MDRNYCFRRKRHSYAACDAALAASIYISMKSRFPFNQKSSEKMVKTSKFVLQKQNKKIDVKQ